MAVLKQSFRIVEYRPHGGGILGMMMSGIMGNFDEDDERDAMVVNLLSIFEELLEEAGAIQSDYAVVMTEPIARPG